MKTGPVLVTGATGYVGGRLVPKILAEGHRVRALGRSLDKLKARTWAKHPLVELVKGDVLDYESLKNACEGCWAAYWLVHSMDPGAADFAETDRRAAHNMARVASETGVERIIYLGGLTPEDQELSHHLASREEVGRILQTGRAKVTILRAAMILGSGSASFEILRYLAERLPVMITPMWVRSRVQPICIRNVVGYLAGCLDHDEVIGETFDIGGPEILTYEELFQMYANEAGLRRRLIVPIPLFSPKLSSYWIHLVTPVPASIARPLAEGLRNTVICNDNRILKIIPQDLMTSRQTFKRILVKMQQQIVETCWTDAGSTIPFEWVQTGDAHYAGGTVISFSYRILLQAKPDEVWDPLVRVGGRTGWYFANYLWRLRGWLDKLFGGISPKRGRRHPSKLVVGDALDFFRVAEIRKDERLLLIGEMKAPGEIVLDFQVKPRGDDRTELRMIGRFLPKGLWGLAYWYSLLPFHVWIFRGTLKAMAMRVGAPIISGPERFEPKTLDTCSIE